MANGRAALAADLGVGQTSEPSSVSGKTMTIALVLTALAAGGGLAVWKRRPAAVLATPSDVEQGMQELAPIAVEHASKSYGLALDYTPESISRAEVALGHIYDDVVANRASQSEAQRLAIRYGAYVGEVIRRKWGGTWSTDHAVAGPGSFPLRLNGHDVFPIGWCIKRVANGPEDNIWHKYQVSIAARPKVSDSPPVQ